MTTPFSLIQLFIPAAALLLCSPASAPRRQLMGTVQDEQHNPLAGAVVRVPGLLSEPCITNAHGRFLLSVPATNATIIVSFACYQSRQLHVGEATEVAVVMAPEPGFHWPPKTRVSHRPYLRPVTLTHPAL